MKTHHSAQTGYGHDRTLELLCRIKSPLDVLGTQDGRVLR